MVITLSKQMPTDTEQEDAQAHGDKDDGHSQDDPEIVPPPIHCHGILRRMEREEWGMSERLPGAVGAVIYHVVQLHLLRDQAGTGSQSNPAD